MLGFLVDMSEIVKYSLDEISKNNGKDGSKVWIIVRNNVYDVTDYLDEVKLFICMIYLIAI